MDAVEYEKGRRRMCRTNILKKGSCEGCDAYSVLMHRCDFVPPPPGRKADDEKVIKKKYRHCRTMGKRQPNQDSPERVFEDVPE